MERVASLGQADEHVKKVTLPHVGGIPVHLHFWHASHVADAADGVPTMTTTSGNAPEEEREKKTERQNQTAAGQHALDDLLPRGGRPLAVAFLLHGRLGDSSALDGMAAKLVTHASQTQQERKRDLLVVTFDLRNHGHRVVRPLANQSWREGNETHAQDMFSIQMGTAHDVSLLISLLPAYLPARVKVELWACVGVSLGGHSAWLALTHEPRISVGVPIIGCCDYLTLMRGRLRSTLKRQGEDAPPSAEEEERYLPASFQAALRQLDVTAMGDVAVEALKTKKLLVLCGSDDRLVPYECSEAFLARLQHAIDADSTSFEEERGACKVIVEQGQGHELSDSMVAATAEWLRRWACGGVSGDQSARL